jgi:hypothetical protein
VEKGEGLALAIGRLEVHHDIPLSAMSRHSNVMLRKVCTGVLPEKLRISALQLDTFAYAVSCIGLVIGYGTIATILAFL